MLSVLLRLVLLFFGILSDSSFDAFSDISATETDPEAITEAVSAADTPRIMTTLLLTEGVSHGNFLLCYLYYYASMTHLL